MSNQERSGETSPDVMGNHYRLWQEQERVAFYRDKTLADFFPTDIWALSRLAPRSRSILEIGCASGRLIELLRAYGYGGKYTGVDIASENIESAKRLYPQQEFLVGDATRMSMDRKFDMVYAAGVVMHVPDYTVLIENMIGWAEKYVAFEIKFAPYDDHMIDISKSFSVMGDQSAYFVLFNYWKFMEWLVKVPGIGRVDVFGYRTPRNRWTTVPGNLSHFISCCLVVEKGDALTEIRADLPFGDLKT
jgi:SAM-dependent methyltransferase